MTVEHHSFERFASGPIIYNYITLSHHLPLLLFLSTVITITLNETPRRFFLACLDDFKTDVLPGEFEVVFKNFIIFEAFKFQSTTLLIG